MMFVPCSLGLSPNIYIMCYYVAWMIKQCNLFNRLAMTAVKALSPNVKATVLRHSLWSDAEEQILATIPSVSHYDNYSSRYHVYW